VSILSRRVLLAISVGVSLIFLTLIAIKGEEFKKTLTKEYFSHKKFLFHLKNVRYVPKKQPSEKDVRGIFERYRIKTESVYRSDTGLEVKAKNVLWRVLPLLLRDLEKNYTIVHFSAVDNTGKGVFEIRIVLR
jgi:hypothetical protein